MAVNAPPQGPSAVTPTGEQPVDKWSGLGELRPVLDTIRSWLRRNVWLRGVLYLIVLGLAAEHGRPWNLGWLRPDEAEEIAEDFLLAQGADLDRYTLIRATEYRRPGAWAHLDRGTVDAGDPAVGYVQRYFAPGTTDGWTVGVSPTGNIYRVERQQFDDEPDSELDGNTALALTEAKLATDLGLPINRLVLFADTLMERPQRNDWGFVFAMTDPVAQPRLRVELSGSALTGLQVLQAPRGDVPKTLPRRGERNRLLGFMIILIGVFIIWQFHRAPLAAAEAGLWGGVTFVLMLLVRGLTFPQAVLLMPADVPYVGYLSRIALSAIVDALQAAILVGLVVATGESALRDHLPSSTTLTRLGRRIRSWPHAWASAARWALAFAAVMVVVEVVAMRSVGLVGIYSKLPPILAGMLSSPIPDLALPAQLLHGVIIDEGLFRLWLFPFTLLFFRPWLGVLVSAGLVTYWIGFDSSQFAEPGVIMFFLWNTAAAMLVALSGILAAILFHVFLLLGLAAITVHWIGFEGAGFGILLGTLVGLILAIGWREFYDERLARSKSDRRVPAGSGA